jgi:hypothetical protein
MGAVADRLDVPIETLRQYLKVDDDSDDLVISDLFESAKHEADQFLNNPFLGADGEDQSIPPPVRTWVLKRLARDYARREDGLASDSATGVGSTTWGAGEYTELWPYRKSPGM